MRATVAEDDVSIDFAGKLGRAAARVEDRLTELLSPGQGEAVAAQYLEEAMAYGTLAGGKRIRPFLLMESARLFDVSAKISLDPACALECIHCYSLIHDDLPAMDDDDLRRGKPSLHVAFDQATAILAGDALLTLAFEILSSFSSDIDASAQIELCQGLAKAAGRRGMVGGQALDLAAEGKHISVDEIGRIQRLKTGALIGFACEAGAIIGNASSTDRKGLRAYGAAVGKAFQLADDLLDHEGDASQVGKVTGKDQRAGKATMVEALGAGPARERLAALEGDALDALAPFGERAAGLADAARFIGSRTY